MGKVISHLKHVHDIAQDQLPPFLPEDGSQAIILGGGGKGVRESHGGCCC